jgi:2-polyprenyl-3-methyl-5-hydroxy-6-metoxy-1,4-benzoquinol methylase
MDRHEKFWNRLAKRYDKPEHIAIVNEYTSIGIIKEYLNKTDTIMDFGCASGTIASSLAGEVSEIHGIDISSKMIQIAKQRAIIRKLDNLHFSCSTIFDDRFNIDSFDMIISFSVLHVLEDRDKSVQRIYELLKPGGLFISLTPCLGEKLLVPGILLFLNKIGILPSISCFKIVELEKIISANGFQIIKSISLDNNPLEHFIISKKDK